MFANRFTAFIDACTLASVLRRNLLLTLAEAEFFRVRWSREVLDETERAIQRILSDSGKGDAQERASAACRSMERAFEEAMVVEYDEFMCVCEGWPDKDDVHVVAAALKTQASTIVTENIKDFPADRLWLLNMEVKTADAFIADTISLDPGKAVAAIKRMRERLKRKEMNAAKLLLEMEAAGLTETVDVLRPYVESL
ncbi:PIN domain-containing protein [Xanthobacter autotrophicus DSM 597]|uniref:PIN domain-containing protein n=1 Tax=Xanthobacter wiegelii TaxID=3119913 RepID=UPI00372699FD